MGAIGEDGFGSELSRALGRRGVSSDLCVRSAAIQTFTYTKLINKATGATGLEVAEQILAEHPEQAIILFSAYLDPDITERAAQLGISACMSKREISRVPEALWKYAPET